MEHKKTYFSICTLCPPRKVKSQVKDQLISALRFRATPVREPQHFIKEYDNEADDIFLKLQRLTSDKILLDHTTPLSEVVEI